MGTEASSQQRAHSDQAVFECAVCSARRVATSIEYDALGYAVCPVCTYTHSP